MIWFKLHWRWSALNGSAVGILMYVLTQGTTDWSRIDRFDPGLESGKWAIRFLLLCLSMSPLNTYLGWSSAIKLRKSTGLWSFGFACVHVLFYLRQGALNWLTWPLPDFLVLGMVGMVILSVLGATSNRWSMKRLGANWKRVHRHVYLAGIAVMTHSMLATQMSKKLTFREPEAMKELSIYAAVLCVLLIVRLPVVRKLLLNSASLWKQTQIMTKPARVDLLPHIHGRESSVSIEPTFVIVPHKIPEKSKQENCAEVMLVTTDPMEIAGRSPSIESLLKEENKAPQ